MMETFLNSELWALLVACAPAVGSVLATVVTVILSLKKLATTISEFRQSNELKQNNEQIKALLQDNKTLKKMNEKLLVELTRIKPKGWTDDEQNKEV